MILQQSKRAYWAVARQMGPGELYVDTRESNHYDDEATAQIDADARNVILAASIAAGNPIMNPNAKFQAVQVTRIEIVQTA